MPAKTLTPEQLADAGRLRSLFATWQQERKRNKEASSQEAAAAILGFGQSALNQYLNGKIPLNPSALGKFCELIKCAPSDISPTIAEAELKSLEKHLHGNSREIRYRPLSWVTELSKFITKLDPISRAMATATIKHLMENPSSHEEVKEKLETILENRRRIALESRDDQGRTGEERIVLSRLRGKFSLYPDLFYDNAALEEIIQNTRLNHPGIEESELRSLIEHSRRRFESEVTALRILKGNEVEPPAIDFEQESDPGKLSDEEWATKLALLSSARKPSVAPTKVREAADSLSRSVHWRQQSPEKVNKDLSRPPNKPPSAEEASDA